MTIIARAMKVTELKTELDSAGIQQQLAAFKDFDEAADYAKEHIAACVKAGIVSGKGSGTIAPKAAITRAEVAAIVRRLLQKSALIN